MGAWTGRAPRPQPEHPRATLVLRPPHELGAGLSAAAPPHAGARADCRRRTNRRRVGGGGQDRRH